MNGAYLRELQPDEYAHFLCKWLTEQGIDWPQDTVHATAPLVQEKIEKFSQYPDFVRFLFEDVSPDGADPKMCAAALERLETVEPWEATRVEEALRALADELGEKPRNAFAPIRLAVTGSKVSPASSRASSCSVATGRSHVSAPLARARRSERLRRGERVERPLKAPPGLEAVVQWSGAGAGSSDCCRRRLHAHGREGRDLPFLKMKRLRRRCWLRPVGETGAADGDQCRPPRRATRRSSRPRRTRPRRPARAGTRRAAVRRRHARRRLGDRGCGRRRDAQSREPHAEERATPFVQQGLDASAPQIDTASATSAVASRAQRSASASSACAVRAAAGGASPYASSLARWSAYCRRRSERQRVFLVEPNGIGGDRVEARHRAREPSPQLSQRERVALVGPGGRRHVSDRNRYDRAPYGCAQAHGARRRRRRGSSGCSAG